MQVYGRTREPRTRLTEVEKQRIALEFGIIEPAIAREQHRIFVEGKKKFGTCQLTVQNFANAWKISRNMPNAILQASLNCTKANNCKLKCDTNISVISNPDPTVP